VTLRNKYEKLAPVSQKSSLGFQGLYMCCNMAWLGSWLKDGPAQCMDNTPC